MGRQASSPRVPFPDRHPLPVHGLTLTAFFYPAIGHGRLILQHRLDTGRDVENDYRTLLYRTFGPFDDTIPVRRAGAEFQHELATITGWSSMLGAFPPAYDDAGSV